MTHALYFAAAAALGWRIIEAALFAFFKGGR